MLLLKKEKNKLLKFYWKKENQMLILQKRFFFGFWFCRFCFFLFIFSFFDFCILCKEWKNSSFYCCLARLPTNCWNFIGKRKSKCWSCKWGSALILLLNLLNLFNLFLYSFFVSLSHFSIITLLFWECWVCFFFFFSFFRFLIFQFFFCVKNGQTPLYIALLQGFFYSLEWINSSLYCCSRRASKNCSNFIGIWSKC